MEKVGQLGVAMPLHSHVDFHDAATPSGKFTKHHLANTTLHLQMQA